MFNSLRQDSTRIACTFQNATANTPLLATGQEIPAIASCDAHNQKSDSAKNSAC